MATVRIPVVRVGDTSKVSVVRVHTKDGSAVSGEDYYPVSQGTHTCCGSQGKGTLLCVNIKRMNESIKCLSEIFIYSCFVSGI